MYKISINNRALDNIKNGKKKIEGRLNRGIFTKIKPDDKILFFNNLDICNVKITNIKIYDSFFDMLNTENFNNVLPYCKNLDEGIVLYNNIYKKNQKNFKVLAIHFDLLLNL